MGLRAHCLLGASQEQLAARQLISRYTARDRRAAYAATQRAFSPRDVSTPMISPLYSATTPRRSQSLGSDVSHNEPVAGEASHYASNPELPPAVDMGVSPMGSRSGEKRNVR
jgi:hypothetical protein